MRDDYLSTSSAPSENIQYFGFGSTSSRCIGVAYVLLPDRFNLYLSTPPPVAEQMDALRRPSCAGPSTRSRPCSRAAEPRTGGPRRDDSHRALGVKR